MTERELRKLTRSDLLELLLQQANEMEQLRIELQAARDQLASRELEIAQAGSIAQAALQLNNVYQATQDACAQYMDNIKNLSGRQEEICARMEAETKAKCDRMLAQAQREADAYWEATEKRIEKLFAPYSGLRELLEQTNADRKAGAGL